MNDITPRRSVLFLPGSNARAIEKARSLPADVIVFDLEDAVAPEKKESARLQVVSALKEGGFGARELVMRINALDTPWGKEDLAALAQAGPDAALLPKVSNPETIMAAGSLLSSLRAPRRTSIWAMIETAQAIVDARAIAAAAQHPDTRLSSLVMGLNDLARETRAALTPQRTEMLPWLMSTLAAARAYGLDIIDAVYNAHGDAEGFRAQCAQARACGFDGKCAIHPAQIGPANEAFSPAPAEIAEARAIIGAYEAPENAGRGAISLEGRMVERLHEEMARRVLALQSAIEARESSASD